MIAVTDGENAYGDGPGLGEIREREQINALGKLGVHLSMSSAFDSQTVV